MKALGGLILLVGFLMVLIIASIGMSFLNAPDDAGGERAAAGMFVLIVLGLPALGFFLFSTLVGAGLFGSGVVRARRQSTSEPRIRHLESAPPLQSRIASVIFFWLAALWSVPYGFLTFVTVITSDSENFLSMFATWMVVAAPAFTLSRLLKKGFRWQSTYTA